MAAAPKISPAAVGGLARLLIGGGLAVYGATNSLFNVEGGHRAIVFNRLVGIKDTVSLACAAPHAVDARSRENRRCSTAGCICLWTTAAVAVRAGMAAAAAAGLVAAAGAVAAAAAACDSMHASQYMAS